MRHHTAYQDTTARTFDAKVELAQSGAVLCLVIGRVSPISAINAVDGSVAVVLSPLRVLAVIELTRLAQVQCHHDVVLAGPVNIDPQRMARFAQLVGVTKPA